MSKRFSEFIRILGRGKRGGRSLSFEEAHAAMSLLAQEKVLPEQVGAFLMLLRVKGETAEEIAGFTRALRESMTGGFGEARFAIDWGAYAGKRRQPPWFLLAALLLGSRGHAVFMHGIPQKSGRVDVKRALEALGMECAGSVDQVVQQWRERGFSYLSLEKISPLAAKLIGMQKLFQVRTPLNTVARMLNPSGAPFSVVGVFHPGFSEIHQEAVALLRQWDALVCKGEGGEFERIPERVARLYGATRDGGTWCETWPRMVSPGKHSKPQVLELRHFRAVWEGERRDEYGEAAVVGTVAMVLRGLGIESSFQQAHDTALRWWQERHHHGNKTA